MNGRKIQAMHMRYGVCHGQKCKTCCHLVGGKYNDRSYYKCELYGLSRSEATDWRLSYPACGAYNMEIDDFNRVVPVIESIKHRQKPPDQPLEGQMHISVFLSVD